MHSSWPFKEAERILQAFGEEREVILSVGYGPSGLPHIGTLGEVVRTTFVANALREISPNTSTKILAFSDDMDGLRKVPENIPQYDMVAECLGRPLTSIPDPFGTHQSYGHHMNHVVSSSIGSELNMNSKAPLSATNLGYTILCC